jgi:aryl-alcohol dehydrogenase-like predicted oxidoreductase
MHVEKAAAFAKHDRVNYIPTSPNARGALQTKGNTERWFARQVEGLRVHGRRWRGDGAGGGEAADFFSTLYLMLNTSRDVIMNDL